MKTAFAISATAASLAADLIVTIAQDNGLSISESLKDQLPTVIITVAGLLFSLFSFIFHSETKNALTTSQAASSDLSHENVALAQAASVMPSPLAQSIVTQEKK